MLRPAVRRIDLLTRPPGNSAVGFANGYRAESALREAGMFAHDGGAHLGLPARIAGRVGVAYSLSQRRSPAYLCHMMGLETTRCFPACLTHEIVPWLWDIWTPGFGRCEAFLRRCRIRTALFQSRQVADHFAQRIPSLQCEWMPEAVDLRGMRPGKSLAERTIHVLELGRKHPGVHAQIRAGLAAGGRRHLYETAPGQIIFPTYDELLAGLGDSQTVICYPRSTTHPHEAGTVEVLTLRYLETMASGAVPVGQGIAELSEMCGFDPVVPMRPDAPLEALEAVLANPAAYQPLVDRNLAWIQQHGGWDVRASQIIERLRARGYEPVPAPANA